MSRARLLKPGFFTNEELHTLHPYGRLLYAGLWCLADREGRLKDRPLRIKAELFPYDKVNVEQLIDQLAALGFVVRYEVENEALMWLPKFKEHQHPHPKEPPSILPACPMEAAATSHASVMHESNKAHASSRPAPSMSHAPPAKTSEAEAGSSIPSEAGSSEAVTGAAAACMEENAYRRITDAWTMATGAIIGRQPAEKFEAYAERLPLDWVLDAIKETGEQGKRAPSYAFAILDRWERDGREKPKDARPKSLPNGIVLGPEGRPEGRTFDDSEMAAALAGPPPPGFEDE